MENKNRIALIGIIVVTVIVFCFCVYALVTNKLEVSDADKFRTEYMELNDKVNEAEDKPYPNTQISEENTVKYLKSKDAVKLLESGTGVIYFGYNNCPWCRSLVPTLTEVGISKKETIYYLDIKNIRSSYEVKNGKLKQTKKGSKDYLKILELLDEKLNEYYVYDEDNVAYDTKEKRLLAPTVVAVYEGEITDIHVGTVNSQNSGYDKLTTEETKELEKIIKDLIDSKNNNDYCTQDGC